MAGTLASSPVLLDLPVRRHTALRDEALRALRNAIFDGRLQPGQRVLENEIAQQIGVSKTPVREAMLELVREGLIVSRPYHGAFVVDMTPDMIREVLEARIALEKYATRLAMPALTEADVQTLHGYIERLVQAVEAGDGLQAAELDLDFHELFYRRANGTLLELWTAIRPRVQLTQVRFRLTARASAERIRRRHEWILDALRSGDPRAVEDEVERHIQYAIEGLLETYHADDGA